MNFERAVHPECLKKGTVRAIETIRNSVVTIEGCFGTCSFCSIATHQGSNVISRSEASILREVKKLASKKGFNGIISDLGGPTANMYGMDIVRGKNDTVTLVTASILMFVKKYGQITADSFLCLEKSVR